MKKAQVVWSDEALNDLESIYDFLAEKSQPAAQRIVESILDKSRQLESFPESGQYKKQYRSQLKSTAILWKPITKSSTAIIWKSRRCTL